MADTKISALTAGSALAGTETFPVVQSSATVKSTISAIATYLQGLTGLNFTNAVRFATIELGAASDTTIARAAAGAFTVEGRGVWRVLASSAVAVVRSSVNGAGDATEATLGTVTVPGGALGPNGRLRINSIWSYTNSANQKLPRIRFGDLATGSQYMSASPTTTATFRDNREIANVNSASSQKGGFGGGSGFGTATTAPITSVLDTASDQTILFTSCWTGAVSGENITLESYVVEILYGA